MTVDLTSLPDVDFLETDASEVEQEVLANYEGAQETTLYPGDPDRLFLEAESYELALLRQLINYTAKQNLLAYAAGDFLDHLGALLGVERLQASAAGATIRFTLSAAQTFAVTIPAGTRVSPDSSLMFATTEAAEIAAGDTTVDVKAGCQTVGTGGNGYAADQINKLVDTIAYVATAANTTVSLGGSDREGDDRLRERIQLAPESFSSAGPEGAYIYWAKTAHQDISDVAVVSPAPVEVVVYVLMKDGELPGDEILSAVAAILSDTKRRPLTDQVTVSAPEAAVFDIDLTYYVDADDSASSASIQEAVESAVDDYVSWQIAVLGRDLNPSKLTSLVMAAGARRVEVTSPAYTVLSKAQVAQPGERSVNYGGLEDG